MKIISGGRVVVKIEYADAQIDAIEHDTVNLRIIVQDHENNGNFQKNSTFDTKGAHPNEIVAFTFKKGTEADENDNIEKVEIIDFKTENESSVYKLDYEKNS